MGLKYYAKPGIGYQTIRPFTLVFYKSFGMKNIQLKILYLLHASARQWHTICTLSSFLSPHSQQSYLCVGSESKHMDSKSCVTCSQTHTHFKLLSTRCPKLSFSTRQKFSHYGLGPTTTFRGFPPVQVLLSQMTLNLFFIHKKGDVNSLAGRDPISLFLGRFISFFISQYSMMLRYPY